ncbi:hypothetical protein GGR57DRAFT_497743 [Xylariaceae sp. FL1272]|nr:hypothetical protein GGR57DRAFT_497743 [Xylariaceae sp. FL1272]
MPSSLEISNLSCVLTKVWPAKYWDSEASTLRPLPFVSNEIVVASRFAPHIIDFTVDLIAGSKSKLGGGRGIWHLQRPSTGEELDKPSVSASGIIELMALARRPLRQRPSSDEEVVPAAGKIALGTNEGSEENCSATLSKTH